MRACIMIMFVSLLCFFKQKTAYEMRISDWSSDVCSSDLLSGHEQEVAETANSDVECPLMGQKQTCRRPPQLDLVHSAFGPQQPVARSIFLPGAKDRKSVV